MRKFIVWAGILTASTVSNSGQELPVHSNHRSDPRLARLMDFFGTIGSPVRHLAPDFVVAADLYSLDWRLLPSICVIESSGGKNSRRNNIFGWDSARRGFASVRESIYWVASRLAHSKMYERKDLNGVLATYNPNAGYSARVKSVMKQVDPTEPLGIRSTSQARISLASGPQRPARLTPAP